MTTKTKTKKAGESRDHSFNGFRVAETEPAKTLVAYALGQLAALEERDAEDGGSTKRTRARKAADQRRYEQQVEALTSDLAYRYLSDPEQWLFTSRSKAVLSKRSRYAPQFVTEKITCQRRSKSDPLSAQIDGVNLTHLGSCGQAVAGAFFAV